MRNAIFVFLLLFPLMLFSCSTQNASVKSIILEGNPTTGYAWEFKGSKNGRVKMVGSEYVPNASKSGMVGVGGRYVFKFVGVETGDDRLFFEYARPWDAKDVADTKKIDVIIGDGLKISFK